jgi:DNA-binding beta-propeller fold protein YncE
VGNDNAAGTEGVRVYDAATLELKQSLALAAPDIRSLAVDPIAGRLYLGHSTTTFDASGVTVLKTADLSSIARYSKHEYGNKVYGISVDPTRGRVYVSARDRYPASLIELARG